MSKIPKSYRLPLVILIIEIATILFLIKADQEKDPVFYNFYRSLPVIHDLVTDKKAEIINSQIQNYVSSVPGNYSVLIHDLKTNKTYSINETQMFDSASLYKLAIMYQVYEDLQAGSLKKDDVLTANS